MKRTRYVVYEMKRIIYNLIMIIYICNKSQCILYSRLSMCVCVLCECVSMSFEKIYCNKRKL